MQKKDENVADGGEGSGKYRLWQTADCKIKVAKGNQKPFKRVYIVEQQQKSVNILFMHNDMHA